jgi:hypothetical protein
MLRCCALGHKPFIHHSMNGPSRTKDQGPRTKDQGTEECGLWYLVARLSLCDARPVNDAWTLGGDRAAFDAGSFDEGRGVWTFGVGPLLRAQSISHHILSSAPVTNWWTYHLFFRKREGRQEGRRKCCYFSGT